MRKATGKKLGIDRMILLALILATVSCGDAGIGFNIRKPVPIDVPVEIPIPDRDDAAAINNLLVVNPPSRTLVYDISEIEAFESALDGIQGSESIVVNSLAYQFSGLDPEEEVDMDGMLISVTTLGETLDLLNVRRRLQNIDRTPISLTDAEREAMAFALANGEAVTANMTFDLAEVPAAVDSITFDYSLIFDITIRARDL